MGDKSASELLHGLLMKEEVGFKFTKQTIEEMAAQAGVDITEGAITGFIHRAVRHGRVQVAGKAKGNENRMLHQYEILDREPWNFKAKGRGSDKGRTIRHTLPLPIIKGYVDGFLFLAHSVPDVEFQVTCIGCGLAGLKHEDVAPMFRMGTKNLFFDDLWKPWLEDYGFKFWGTF